MDTALSMRHSAIQLTFGFVALKEWSLSKLKESCCLSSVWKRMLVLYIHDGSFSVMAQPDFMCQSVYVQVGSLFDLQDITVLAVSLE